MEKKKLVIQVVVRMVMGILFFMTIFFGTAGTWNWPEAWILIVIQFTVSIVMSIWLLKHNIELMKERMTFMKKGVRGWDKVFMVSTIPLFLILLAIPGLDAVRYQWSSVPLIVKTISFIVIGAGWYLVFRVMQENTYLSRIVEIQVENGHEVVTTGPYTYVRHPMYAGIIAMLFAIPLALGSIFGLIPGVLLAIAFILRTALEDKTLIAELTGYDEYALKTKFRLFPGIW